MLIEVSEIWIYYSHMVINSQSILIQPVLQGGKEISGELVYQNNDHKLFDLAVGLSTRYRMEHID
jgi:hypothetical protein